MKEKKKQEQEPQIDPHLDVPAEANTDRHINFLEIEEGNEDAREPDKATQERRKQWEEGLKEGREDFEKNKK